MTVAALASQPPTKYQRQLWIEGLLAVAILIVAWIYGFLATRSLIEPLVSNVLPGVHIVRADCEIFTGLDAQGRVVGHAAAADATGYGGPVYLLVGVDTAGDILGIQVVEQRETPGFYALLRDRRFLQGFLGRPAASPFVLGEDVDVISGATLTAGAVAEAIRLAARKIEVGALVRTVPPIRFGFPEIALVSLFAAAIMLTRVRGPRRSIFRWVIMLVSMLLLGFWLNQPLTLANFASLLVGYWPTWQDHLYWYLLLGGVTAMIMVTGKNTYCYTICPFAGVQECFGKLGDAKPFLPVGGYRRLRRVTRWLAVLALALGLAFRQPGAASFEPFGTLFSFSAGFFPWMLLVFVLFASLIILRPFCHYLCPVGAILDFMLFLRNQGKRLWKRTKAAPAG